MRTGVFGGTFDPVHNGHLMMADEARVRLDLAKVLFIPAGQPWLKADSAVSAVEHRVRMVLLAIADNTCFSLSRLEVDRQGPSYTVDTLAGIKAQGKDGDELFFILGWDSLNDLPRWREPERLVTLCRLVAIPRPGCQPPDLEALGAVIHGLAQRVILLDKPVVDISASDIRRRVAGGEPIDNLVPAPVAEYIRKNKLYLP